MYFKADKCPNNKCSNHTNPAQQFYSKKGYYKTKKNKCLVPRYKCKMCGKYFSSNTFKDTYRQRNISVNERIYKLLCSGVTQRRIAKITDVTRDTVVSKFLWLAQLSKNAHECFLDQLETSYVQFDEMETYEHTKLKPLSIPIAIRAKTGEIISLQTAEMAAKGPTARKSVEKYGQRKDDSYRACIRVIESVRKVAKDKITIACDGKPSYPNIIRSKIPDCNIDQYVNRKLHKLPDTTDESLVDAQENKESVQRKNFDPLFMLNHTCAKLRADLSRLVRRTWSTTKKMSRLQCHLDLYIAYQNGYSIV